MTSLSAFWDSSLSPDPRGRIPRYYCEGGGPSKIERAVSLNSETLVHWQLGLYSSLTEYDRGDLPSLQENTLKHRYPFYEREGSTQ